LSGSERGLQRRFNAAGSDGAPTNPSLKGAEQPYQNKNRREHRYFRDQTGTGKKENNSDPTAGDTAFVIDVRFHPRKVRDFGWKIDALCRGG